MTMQTNNVVKLENFDDVWGHFGQPSLVEKKFLEFLPQAELLPDKSIYLQLLSQLALSQALLKKFDMAHATLDKAKSELTDEHDLAQTRILLERGRVYQQAGDIAKARVYFERSYELSLQRGFEAQAINAAHMIAIVADATVDKIAWNQRAIDLGMATKDDEARRWMGSIWNNLGGNYLETQELDKAMQAFEKSLEYRKEEKYAPNIRFARFRVAQVFRLLGNLDRALMLQHELLMECDAMAFAKKIDMPVEMFILTRGWIYEELSEIYQGVVKGYAKLAYDALSSNEAFAKNEPTRLERLAKIKA